MSQMRLVCHCLTLSIPFLSSLVCSLDFICCCATYSSPCSFLQCLPSPSCSPVGTAFLANPLSQPCFFYNRSYFNLYSDGGRPVSPPCMRTFKSPPSLVKTLIKDSGQMTRGEEKEQYCAAYLTYLCASALGAIEDAVRRARRRAAKVCTLLKANTRPLATL